MFDKEIDANEYREIKEDFEGEIVKLERKLGNVILWYSNRASIIRGEK